MRRAACLTVLLLSLAAATTARAHEWRPVPGAGALQLDLASLDLQGSRIRGWVRYLASPAQADPFGLDAPARPPRAWRQLALAEVDCRARTVRALAGLAYDTGGRALAASSVPGPQRELPPLGELALLHDALCELAREQRGR